MKFVDMCGDAVNVRVAAQFNYKGYKVSASTILTPYASIAIMDANDDFVRTEVTTVEDAILIIDNELPPMG